jgi:hypothetical protein
MTLEGITRVEPCKKLIHHMSRWVTERKAAGLPTVINPQVVSFDGTDFCFKESTEEASEWLAGEKTVDDDNSIRRSAKPVRVTNILVKIFHTEILTYCRHTHTQTIH